MLVHRVEHRGSKRGPFSHYGGFKLIYSHSESETISFYEFRDDSVRNYEFNNPKFAFNVAINHRGIDRNSFFNWCTHTTWLVCCKSLWDLGSWFGDRSLLELFEIHDYVLVTYEVEDNLEFCWFDDISKQGMFDPRNAQIVSVDSVLAIPTCKGFL